MDRKNYTAAFYSISHRFLDESLCEANVSPKVRRIIRAIYPCASGAVQIQRASGDKVFSDHFDIRRGAIQGDIYSPPSFTLALDRIFRRYDSFCDGIGGPPLSCPVVSKLEYADDAALLNKNTSDATKRLTTLANDGSADACVDISLKKTKVMHVRKYEPVSATTEDEVIALNLKHKCSKCDRTFPTQKGLNIHCSRWCNPGGPVRSRKGSLADKAAKNVKLVKQATELPKVTLNGHNLENVITFDYLGCRLSGNGDDSTDMKQRMNIATDRFRNLSNIWRDNRLSVDVKIDLYKKAICSVFAHVSEAWNMIPSIQRSVNGFNSRCLHHITGRSYRLEATTPSFNLVKSLQRRRLRWLGHILRMPEDRLLRRFVIGISSGGPPYKPGSLLMDINLSIDELIVSAQDREIWRKRIDDMLL